MIKMKALDTLHISAVGPENILAGNEFEVPETHAKELEDRGLAKRVGGSKAPAKAEAAAPENKMESAPANKADKRPLSAASIKSKAK